MPQRLLLGSSPGGAALVARSALQANYHEL